MFYTPLFYVVLVKSADLKVEETLCSILECPPSLRQRLGQRRGCQVAESRKSTGTLVASQFEALLLWVSPIYRPSWRFSIKFTRVKYSDYLDADSDGIGPYPEEGILGFRTCRWSVLCLYIPSSQRLGSTTVSSVNAFLASPALNT